VGGKKKENKNKKYIKDYNKKKRNINTRRLKKISLVLSELATPRKSNTHK
jgi:hypothetical protein